MITLEQLLQYSIEHPDGFTIDREGNPITKGFAVALKATKNSFGEYGAKHVLKYIEPLDGRFTGEYIAIGGWKETHSTILWYDAVIILHDYDIAIAAALHHEQKSFYDLENNILCTFQKQVI